MSAFLVSDNHINALVTAALSAQNEYQSKEFILGLDMRDLKHCDMLAEMLLEENYKSLNDRYRNEFGEAHKIKHVPFYCDYVQVIKAVDCYQYQACEYDGWENSLAKKATDKIRDWATDKILKAHGYDQAKWGIE